MVTIDVKETPTQKELTINNYSNIFSVILVISTLTIICIPWAIYYLISLEPLDIGFLIFFGVYFAYIIISILYLRTRKMTLIKDKKGGRIVLIKRYYFKDEKKTFDNYKNLLICGYKNKIPTLLKDSWDISIEDDMKITKLSTSTFFPVYSRGSSWIFDLWKYTELDAKKIAMELDIPFDEIK
jgi:hypothetical protein